MNFLFSKAAVDRLDQRCEATGRSRKQVLEALILDEEISA